MSDRGSPQSLVHHIRDLARTHAQRVAYTWLLDGEEERERLTFAELDARARAIAAELSDRGLAGERALLLYPPGLAFVEAFLGCLYAGVVAVPLNTPRNEKAAAGVGAIARHAEAAVVLSTEGLLAENAVLRKTFGGLRWVATDTLPTEFALGWRPGSIEPADLAFIQYTSGSTGSPKGVEVTHANLVRNEEMIRAGFGHDESTVFVGWLPLFHDMGLVGNVLQPLYLGVHSVLMAPNAFVQKPVRWLRALTRYGGTTSGSPNFGYALCVTRVRPAELEGLDLSAWRVAYNGSEPVRAETMDRFTEKFERVGFRREAFYPCYGLAEASLFVTGGRPDEPFTSLDVDGAGLRENRVRPARPADPGAQRLVGCGRPWLDQEVLIVDPETARPTLDGRIGEIWIRGGNVARGYRNLRPGELDPFHSHLADGGGPYLRTGDLGFLDRGELFVTGRLKDVVIQNGRNYYPQDIELCAGESHPFFRVDFTAAFTVDDGAAERLVVVQEVHRGHLRSLLRSGSGARPIVAELVGAVRAAVSRRFGLSVWKVVLIPHATIPKTSSGKIQRRKCRGMWSRGELVELAPSSGTHAEREPLEKTP